jgi:ABC-type multidrug transport system ATPase subunit
MADEIFEIIKRLNDSGTTVILITHKIDYAAMFASRAIVLQRGRIAYEGPVLELIANLQLMRENSLDIPDTTKLAMQLSKHGAPPWLVKFEDLEAVIQEMVGENNGSN